MMSKNINYVTTKFSESQLKNYRTLSTIINISNVIFIASIIFTFFISFWIIIIGVLQLWIVQFYIFRCVNCFSKNKALTEEKTAYHSEFGLKPSPTQILFVQTYKCKQCDFQWENLVERTGHLEGIGKMSRDIKVGGKIRRKGESYVSWWRRNKN